ncbi:metallophosphoesterase family protein [Bacillus suaedae]|uniref:Phosphoesterase n=1 Tax=Halalkalibacter suaedae TaxID=2822140 RepID=A0A941APT7_9BACI|nr:metallophosphoesterase family protein [Bacillus suaedae]MBP3950458.1 metallophosphoesterase [Bacillus suaedae]
MNVIVISDTHIPNKAKLLPPILKSELLKADLIVHAGDWQSIEVYKELSQYSEVKGVIGNVDNDELLTFLPDKLLLAINGFKIGVVHGHGKGTTTEKRALKAFQGTEVDLIIFGHSHIPLIKNIDGIVLFNPGSLTDKRRQPYYSYGKLTINKTITTEHVFFEKK